MDETEQTQGGIQEGERSYGQECSRCTRSMCAEYRCPPMRSARWVRNYTGMKRSSGLIEQIVNKTVQPKGTPAGLNIHEETGTKLHITYMKIMRMYDLSPKESQRVRRQKGRPELAISLQKASSTPRKGRIYPGHGRTRHGVRTQARGKRIAVPYTPKKVTV